MNLSTKGLPVLLWLGAFLLLLCGCRLGGEVPAGAAREAPGRQRAAAPLPWIGAGGAWVVMAGASVPAEAPGAAIAPESSAVAEENRRQAQPPVPRPTPQSGPASPRRTPAGRAQPPAFRTDMLWSGSWEEEGNLANRADIRLSAWGFNLRAQALDRRYSPLRDAWQANWEDRLPAFSGGLYHRESGSRLLYGVLNEWGLSARLSNVWAKSPAYPAARKPLGADLKTEYSATGKDEAYLYLSGEPWGGPSFSLRPYASLWAGEEAPVFAAGLDLRGSRTQFRAEGLYTRRTLPAEEASAWFSLKPPLPERDAEIYGAGLLFTAPWFALAADGALSRVFGWGEDYYGNLALSLGDKPWQLSLAAEAAGDRFNDRGGTDVGAGLRLGARFEWKQGGSGLFRADTVLTAPAPGLPLNRGSYSLYYRFPTKRPTSLFRPGRISLSAARDSRDPAKVLDSADAGLTWRLGPLGLSLSASVEALARDGAGVFPLAQEWDFSSAGAGGELSWSPGIFQFKIKTGRSWSAKKGPLQDASVSAAISGKRGRLSLKLSTPDFPEAWEGYVSWRLTW